MAFSEKLYQLRKQHGLSQEQLAERLNVSRQAISKWENGVSLPESDKLLAISRCFQISLDVLMTDSPGPTSPAEPPDTAPSPAEVPPGTAKNLRLTGMLFSISGAFCLCIWGVLTLFRPAAAQQLQESSAIHLDGSGIFLLLSLAVLISGAVLLLRHTAKK